MDGTRDPTRTADRILVVAPMGADAQNVSSVLRKAGIAAVPCHGVATAVAAIETGCGAVLLTEEALNDPQHTVLASALQQQPPWSDLPVILVVTGGKAAPASDRAVQLLGAESNLVLVERPLRATTLLSTVRAALRARRRQYEVQNLLRERDELLTSLEHRVADRTAKLEHLNAELEAFSYSVSHDLRAPLRSLESYARILCEEFADILPEEARHYAERIARNAEKMDRLTRDVLTLSQLTRGDVRMDALDLDTVLGEVIDQYPDLAAARQHLHLDLPLGHAFGHSPSLTQCFSNLLQNALKFIPHDRTPRVRIYSEFDARRVRVWVHDNGIGIDPAHHQRIFGIFERATSAHFPGTGIGLAIAKKAVEKMGGTIGVESTLGAGARFWIDLARADAPGADGHEALRAQPAAIAQ